jgi:MurNAc alpha-1-phosphate uridylyltransferase
MLLAAGLGTRMRPLTNDRPKALIDVGGRTLIDRAIDKTIAAGVRRIVVNLHYRADQLRRHLEGRTDVDIVFSDESERLLETGGGVVRALPLLGRGAALIINTDVTWPHVGDTALRDLIAAFDPAETDALLLLADRKRTIGFDGAGDFFLGADDRLTRRGEHAAAPFVFAGAYMVATAALADYSPEPFSANVYWNDFMRRGRLKGRPMTGLWLHVGDPRGRQEAEERLALMGPGA